MYVHVLFEMFTILILKHAFLPTCLNPFHPVSKGYLLLLQCLDFAKTSASFVSVDSNRKVPCSDPPGSLFCGMFH